MRVTVNIEALNHSPNLFRLNQSTAQIQSQLKPDTGKSDANTDKVSISPMGKAMSMMESLMKQKESLNQKKHELIERTLEKGGSLGEIQEQLESFEESMEMIDEQISTLMENTLEGQDKENTDAKADSQGSKNDGKLQTEEEAEAAQFVAVAASSADLSAMKTAHSTKIRLEGRLKVLSQEISQDRSIAPALQKSNRKQKEIAELRNKIKDVSDTFAQAAGSAAKHVKEHAEQASQPLEENGNEQRNGKWMSEDVTAVPSEIKEASGTEFSDKASGNAE